VVRIQLPDGCYGLDMADGSGKKYTARPGDRVEVSDNHARMIRNSYYGSAGIMSGSEQYAIGTKRGRWCTTCQPARIWNVWNASCPRCGADTTEEHPS
jgi:hypothetical protein